MTTATYPLTNKQLVAAFNGSLREGLSGSSVVALLKETGYTPAKIRDQLVSAGYSQQQIHDALTYQPSFGKQLLQAGADLLPIGIIDLASGSGGAIATSEGGAETATSEDTTADKPITPKTTPVAPFNPSNLSNIAKDAGAAGVLAAFLAGLWSPARLLELVAGIILLYMGIRTLTGGALPAPSRIARTV